MYIIYKILYKICNYEYYKFVHIFFNHKSSLYINHGYIYIFARKFIYSS